MWVGAAEISAVDPATGTARTVYRPGDPPGPLLGPLYDALAADIEALPRPRALDLLVDRDVSGRTLLWVLYTLSRAGVERFHLVSGPLAAPGALVIEPPRFGCHLHERAPVLAVQYDLSIAWSDDGPRAWALPRPHGRAPFDASSEEPPPDADPTPQGPLERVPIALAAAADPPLRADDLRTVVAALCALDQGPLGVELSLREDTRFGDLVAAALAAAPPLACAGPRQVSGFETATHRSPVPLADLHRHVTDRLPPADRLVPPHVSPSRPPASDDMIK